MTKVLFDTNIILDIALKRIPYFDNSARLFTFIDTNKITGYISATTITDIYYIAKSEKGHDKILEFISNLIEIVEITGVDRDVIEKAMKSEMKDFEDAIQVSTAEFNEIDCIITRNKKDFNKSTIKIFTPEEFLETIK